MITSLNLDKNGDLEMFFTRKAIFIQAFLYDDRLGVWGGAGPVIREHCYGPGGEGGGGAPFLPCEWN